ncbi:MAG TPA: MogA/MoaB family molybdenum cofactor biosynthesis protein [Terriglobales bacterium]
MTFTAAVLTISDRAAAGQRDDRSGPAVVAALEQAGFRVIAADVLPDERARIEASLMQLSETVNLIVTTGGTGIAPRDVTPEATRAVADKVVEGMAERMRAEGAKKTPLAALSRGVCAIRGAALIVNVPGSPTAAVESLQAVLPVLPHALELLAGNTGHN